MVKKLRSRVRAALLWRNCAAAGAALVLVGACATAPGGRTGGAAHPGGSEAGSRVLFVCGGTEISNAPPTAAGGRIAGYEPFAEVRGRRLARAPVDGCLSSGYGIRAGTGRMHHGVDLYTGRPATVYAAGDGEIEFAGDKGAYGETIVIRHGAGVKTRYAHLSGYARKVREGARVRAGEPIAETGRSGNATAVHLHFEIIVDGRAEDPLTVGR